MCPGCTGWWYRQVLPLLDSGDESYYPMPSFTNSCHLATMLYHKESGGKNGKTPARYIKGIKNLA